MRHGVIRRGDHIPLTLVHSDQSVDGLVALDMMNGRVVGLQCKALIIADEGFEGAFSSGVVGLGMDMAFRAGIALRDMEFMTHHPLTIKGTNLFLPTGLLTTVQNCTKAQALQLKSSTSILLRWPKPFNQRFNPSSMHVIWANPQHGGLPCSAWYSNERALT